MSMEDGDGVQSQACERSASAAVPGVRYATLPVSRLGHRIASVSCWLHGVSSAFSHGRVTPSRRTPSRTGDSGASNSSAVLSSTAALGTKSPKERLR